MDEFDFRGDLEDLYFRGDLMNWLVWSRTTISFLLGSHMGGRSIPQTTHDSDAQCSEATLWHARATQTPRQYEDAKDRTTTPPDFLGTGPPRDEVVGLGQAHRGGSSRSTPVRSTHTGRTILRL